MSDYNGNFARTVPADRADMSVDAGLRSFMLGVYNKVALGLLLSAGLAFLTGTYPPVRDLMYSPEAGSGDVSSSGSGASGGGISEPSPDSNFGAVTSGEALDSSINMAEVNPVRHP